MIWSNSVFSFLLLKFSRLLSLDLVFMCCLFVCSLRFFSFCLHLPSSSIKYLFVFFLSSLSSSLLWLNIFKALDLEFMRRLCTKVNIIPVIGERKIVKNIIFVASQTLYVFASFPKVEQTNSKKGRDVENNTLRKLTLRKQLFLHTLTKKKQSQWKQLVHTLKLKDNKVIICLGKADTLTKDQKNKR